MGDVKRLLGGATVFVGNDSGPAHMAAAFGVPVVVLYGSSDPVIWAPWRTKNAIFLAGAAGIASIQAEDVVESALQLADSA